MIGEYPEFTPIDHSLRYEIQTLTVRYPLYSDYNAVNLLCWNGGGLGSVAMLYGNLVLYRPQSVGEGFFISFLGDNDVESTTRLLLDAAETKTGDRCLQRIPAATASVLVAGGSFVATEDVANHDYIISLHHIAHPEGSELRHFRRSANQFIHDYGERTVLRSLDVTKRATQIAIEKVFLVRETAKASGEWEDELEALHRLLCHADGYLLYSYGLELAGTLEGFIICEVIDSTWSFGHFWKANSTYRGIYSYLMLQTAQELVKLGITKMNIHQDLGIEGLRRFKHTLAPTGLLKKYTIREVAERHETDGGPRELASLAHPALAHKSQLSNLP